MQEGEEGGRWGHFALEEVWQRLLPGMVWGDHLEEGHSMVGYTPEWSCWSLLGYKPAILV